VAGIGMVESHHGTYRGATIAPNGDVTHPSAASALTAPQATCLADTDCGALDGDGHMDRAMGPMQFIPETWNLRCRCE